MDIYNRLTLAIDFDGTIVEDAYPKIGKPRLFAFETLQKLQQDGHRLILWTYRNGVKLQEAVEFCKKNGIYGDLPPENLTISNTNFNTNDIVVIGWDSLTSGSTIRKDEYPYHISIALYKNNNWIIGGWKDNQLCGKKMLSYIKN